MLTRETFKQLRSEGGINHAALTMAISIFIDRIRTLPKEDRNDLYDLTKELAKAEKCEDTESIAMAMLEILEQDSVRVKELNLAAEEQPGKGLQKWMDYVSEKIRVLRKEADMTQEELAEKTGLPQSHISRLESAKHSPSRATLEKIANALGVPVSAFDPSA